jgi:hypothetical protein
MNIYLRTEISGKFLTFQDEMIPETKCTRSCNISLTPQW